MVAAGFWLRNLFRMEYRVSALCSNIRIVSWRAVSIKERQSNIPSTCDIYNRDFYFTKAFQFKTKP